LPPGRSPSAVCCHEMQNISPVGPSRWCPCCIAWKSQKLTYIQRNDIRKLLSKSVPLNNKVTTKNYDLHFSISGNTNCDNPISAKWTHT
jgi:hypothetical protein